VKFMSTADRRLDFLTWQKGVWDQMSRAYEQEIDPRMAPIAAGVVRRAAPRAGMLALDIGCGTGSVALKLAVAGARVHAIDISDEMLRITAARAARSGFDIRVEPGRAEHIPALDDSSDLVTASLSLMFVSDKATAAAEIARVLKAGGRFVASSWGPPERCDIVRFQRILGQHAPEPPVKGVGPGSLSDPQPFLHVLAAHKIQAQVEEETVSWDHPNLQHALDTFAPVTASMMSPAQLEQAVAEIRAKMWPDPAASRPFSNSVLYIVGARQ